MTEISDKKAQQISGNILIYILGAIFLMGLLIVLLKGNFQEGVGIDAEQTALKVMEVQRYATAVERGVNTILQNGRSENEIRFAHPDAAAGYGSISSDPGRQVFSPDGGDVEYQAPPAGVQTSAIPWYFSARSAVKGVGTTCTANSCVDLVAYLPEVTKDFCLAVNNAIGITNPSGDTPVDPDSFTWITLFDGTYTYAQTIDTTGNYADGRLEGCIKYSTSYYYYRVLLAR